MVAAVMAEKGLPEQYVAGKFWPTEKHQPTGRGVK
jgi:hypothetical protein